MASESAAAPRSPPEVPRRRRSLIARFGRLACVVGGVALAAYFVNGAGVERVAEGVADAGAWVPALVALEVVVIVADAFAARALLRGTRHDAAASPGQASLATWVRASALANACGVFLPAGRAAGEAARGATLSAGFGLSRVVAACARLQACSLLGTATASLVLASLVATLVTGSRALAPLLFGNAVVCGALGGGVFLLLRSRVIGGWVRRLLSRVVASTPEAPPSRRASFSAFALCTLGRVVQTLQYGIAVLAVGGTFGVRSAVTAQGIHLVGASGGDLVPNQVGAMEAAYRYFAQSLGFADAPARALSIAVVMHGVQVAVALVGLGIAGVLPRERAA